MRDTLALHFLVGSAVGAAIALGALQYWYRRDWNASRRQYGPVPETAQPSTANQVRDLNCGLSDFISDEVLSEQFTRNVQFFGQDGQLKIANAFVVVVGLGVNIRSTYLIYPRRLSHLTAYMVYRVLVAMPHTCSSGLGLEGFDL